MNRVITINLNGNAYQLEEGGYEALRAYLDNAARRLEGNPDKDEIIADIEQAIADKFRALLGANKTVVITKEVTVVITEMGPVDDGAAETTGTQSSTTSNKSTATGKADLEEEPKPVRGLYRIRDGAMLSGLCNGLAAFWKTDVSAIRLLFVICCLLYGSGIVVYLILSFIVPEANTPGEKAAASGTAAATAQEFIRRSKAGYYEGMKTFHDKEAHRAWKRKFKHEMRGWKHGFEQQMHQNAQHWQQNWAQHPRHWIGMGFTLEILKWVKLLLLALGVYAIYTLNKYGTVFGISVPANFPFWIGVILIIIAYKFATWPIKVMQYGYYTQGMTPPYSCWAGPFGGVAWLGILIVTVWCLNHYVPQFHESLKQLPPLLHQGVDTVQKWLEQT